MEEKEFTVDAFRNAEQTEKVIEAAVEVKETPAEVKEEKLNTEVVVEGKEDKKPSLFEKFTKPEGTVELTDAQKAEQLEKDNLKAKVLESEEYKAVLSEVEKLKADDDLTKKEIQAYKDNALAKLFGKDLTEITPKEFAKKLLGEDFTKLSDEQLITKAAEKKFSKLKDDDLAEAIADELTNFEVLKPYEQKQRLAEIVEDLEKSQPENDVLKLINELKDKQVQSSEPDPEKYMSKDALLERIKETVDVYNKLGDGIEGQVYETKDKDGNVICSFTAKKENAVATTQLFEKIANGNLPTDELYMIHFKASNFDAFGASEYARGKADQAIKDANPSKGESSAVIIPLGQEKGITEESKTDDFRKAKSE